MAARLKRLEGMVREMIDADGNPVAAGAGAAVGVATGSGGIEFGAQQAMPALTASGGAGIGGGKASQAPAPAPVPPVDAGGVVVQGQKATSYVGATHFMAMLDDVSWHLFPLSHCAPRFH